ncbi:MAG: hypothetical protein Q8Q41_02750 [bacterium]|nr:hypothetical protein [bacterium]
MEQNRSRKRLFITGIPTAGKSYLAKKLAQTVNGVAVLLDDFQESLASSNEYGKWVNFYLDQDEKQYLTTTSPDQMWKNLIVQSEALWPAFLKKMAEYETESRPVIFECVNILPHLAHRDLKFPGIILIGSSQKETLERNKQEPRWGKTPDLQEFEAKMFFEVERPHYKSEAEKYGYPVFEDSDRAFEQALLLIEK